MDGRIPDSRERSTLSQDKDRKGDAYHNNNDHDRIKTPSPPLFGAKPKDPQKQDSYGQSDEHGSENDVDLVDVFIFGRFNQLLQRMLVLSEVEYMTANSFGDL